MTFGKESCQNVVTSENVLSSWIPKPAVYIENPTSWREDHLLILIAELIYPRIGYKFRFLASTIRFLACHGPVKPVREPLFTNPWCSETSLWCILVYPFVPVHPEHIMVTPWRSVNYGWRALAFLTLAVTDGNIPPSLTDRAKTSFARTLQSFAPSLVRYLGRKRNREKWSPSNLNSLLQYFMIFANYFLVCIDCHFPNEVWGIKLRFGL